MRAGTAATDSRSTLIEALDAEYGLGLPIKSDGSSSNIDSPNRKLSERVLQELVAQGISQLVRKLDRFRVKAVRIQQNWVHETAVEPNSTSATSALKLAQCPKEQAASFAALYSP